MIWAACALAFFGLLRIGEMTCRIIKKQFWPHGTSINSGLAYDHSSAPTVMFVTIKCSKTDPFRKGVTLSLGRTARPLCRGITSGPLFRFANGEPLTRNTFVSWIKSGLAAAGIDHKDYNGHSFRIGAAITAASKGVEDSIIKTLGRWESTAYLCYVKIPREQLISYTQILEEWL